MKEQMIIGFITTPNNQCIGREDGSFPLHIPEIITFFRSVTTNHSVLMGRKTWENTLRRMPLPSRVNYVLSEKGNVTPTRDVIPVRSIEHFLDIQPEGKTYVIGGAETFNGMMPFCDELIINFVKSNPELTGKDIFLNPDLFSNVKLELIETVMDHPKYTTEHFKVLDK